MTDLDKLNQLLVKPESELLEFKEGKDNFGYDKLTRYLAALANEGGGRLVLGVSDERPRRVVGSQAVQDLDKVKLGLLSDLGLRVSVQEFDHPDGRVLVFSIPSHPPGRPVQYKGRYLMRSGESLVAMTPDVLQRMFREGELDFSGTVCDGATLADLEPEAIETFGRLWAQSSGNSEIGRMDQVQLLEDAELTVDGDVTYAGLILLGTSKSLSKFLAQAEIIFEYRPRESAIPFSDRREYRVGFLRAQDALWQTVNLRNEIHQYQEGLFMRRIPTFNEAVTREAILNAVAHREYRSGGSVFVRQFPTRLEIASPGGFPPGITPENMLYRQYPKNRRLAEALAKCGLVERSGQGADRMFSETVKESKPLPDYSQSDEHHVQVVLRGEIRDPQFLRFLEEVGEQTGLSFGVSELLVLDLVHRDQPIPEHLNNLLESLESLVESGAVERHGRGKGRRFILSRRFYNLAGKDGVYTRKKGLDRDTNKELLRKHIRESKQQGARFRELQQVLPDCSKGQVKALLRELKGEEVIHVEGKTRGAKWFSGPESAS